LKQPRSNRLAAGVSIVVFACFALAGCTPAKKASPPPPPLVLVSPAVRQDVSLYTKAVASIDGYINAEIRARVKGFLRTQNYKDGGPVRQGDLLFTIEQTDYVAAVASATAAVTRARVAQAHAKVQLDRDQNLSRTGTLSQQDLDNATANLADTEGQVQAAQAALEQASLNLSYTQMRSPIDGVAGIALMRVGNLVGQDGATLLTTVSQLDPVRVNFPLVEADYMKHADLLQHLERRDLAWVKQQFAVLDATKGDDAGVALILADGTTYPHRGVIVSVDRQIDASTGTIQVQALVPNPEGLLRPGGYGTIQIKRHDAGQGVIAVPDKALITVQGTYSVGVVGADDKVQLRRVEVGASVQGMRVITKGVSEGESIVVDGIQKISDGALVAPKPATSAPAAKN
jgi:membrane fusion protein (multidrug efflux system)